MYEITIKLGKGHGLADHTDEINTLAKEAIGEGYLGLSIDEQSVRLLVEDDVAKDDATIQAVEAAIRAFDPRQAPKKPEPSKEELISKLDAMQGQLDELRAYVENLKG